MLPIHELRAKYRTGISYQHSQYGPVVVQGYRDDAMFTGVRLAPVTVNGYHKMLAKLNKLKPDSSLRIPPDFFIEELHPEKYLTPLKQ